MFDIHKATNLAYCNTHTHTRYFLLLLSEENI